MSRKFALVPAAGSGTRLGEACPKQYVAVAGAPMIVHTLRALSSCAAIDAVFVVLSPSDTHWHSLDWSDFGKLEPLFQGGATRAETVLNGLRAVEGRVANDDWVLVHDAARPCLSQDQLARLIDELEHDPVGGILAAPVSDTLKRQGEGQRIAGTSERHGLWQAQTPQMFRYGLLRRALHANADVTDEAGAVEALGQQPRLVVSDATNLKVTYPQDRMLAEWILSQRRQP